jgi:hypothetical protein
VDSCDAVGEESFNQGAANPSGCANHHCVRRLSALAHT